jgi:hypothetical protein
MRRRGTSATKSFCRRRLAFHAISAAGGFSLTLVSAPGAAGVRHIKIPLSTGLNLLEPVFYTWTDCELEHCCPLTVSQSIIHPPDITRGGMGDSQNWSSFEEPATPKKPKAVAKPQPTPADVGVGSAAGSTGAGDLLSAANVRLVQQRLMFGAIVGFCTGATFGSSTWAA